MPNNYAKKGSTDLIKIEEKLLIYFRSTIYIFCDVVHLHLLRNWAAAHRWWCLPARPILLAGLLTSAVTVIAQPAGRSLQLANPSNSTITEIDLPDSLYANRPTLLVFYSLPNGNTIAWTKGKKLATNNDWHYDIQHIKAQTDYLRQVMADKNLIVAYMYNTLKSWPAWKREAPGRPAEIRRLVDSIAGMFAALRPEVMLNSHSGGGSFIFGYIDAVPAIPAYISRIAFIDSDYGYEDSLHTAKLTSWLKQGKHYLTVLAYNDSVVVFNGKPLVSPTGGTWYRSKLLLHKLERTFRFESTVDTAFQHYSALSNRIDIRLKTNEEGRIYHTEQVARNGFIHTVIGGTRYARKAHYRYWGSRIYTAFIPD